MKIGLVYTSTTPELIELVEKEVTGLLPETVEIASFEDATILQDVISNGFVDGKSASRLVGMYIEAVKDGCDAILNICSSVGEVADSVQELSKFIGVPIVRIDEEMCKEAVRIGDRIGVMATLNSTMDPTINTIKRVSRELGKPVKIVKCLVDGAFGLSQEKFKELMSDKASEIYRDVDVILFAQGSMAYCDEYISEKYNTKVLSSPKFGAKALHNALEEKGII